MQITNPILSSNMIDDDGNLWKRKRLEIGVWNMDIDVEKIIPHGLSGVQWQSVGIEEVMVFDDTYAVKSALSYIDNDAPIDHVQGGLKKIDNTNIVITRLTGGWYDGLFYTSVLVNRGHIIFWYIE